MKRKKRIKIAARKVAEFLKGRYELLSIVIRISGLFYLEISCIVEGLLQFASVLVGQLHRFFGQLL